jgi:DNA-binding NarL/FixJ family response regulator
MIARETGNLPPAGTPFPVTPCQDLILELAARGLCDKEIARRLNVTHRTIRSQLERVYLRSGERGRARVAVLWALAHAGPRRRLAAAS